MTDQMKKIIVPSADTKSVEVKDWPNLNIVKWRKWGFTVERVLRTSKYHFIFHRTTAGLKISEGENASLTVEGKFFQIDDEMEKKLEKMSWIAYALIILFFASLVRFFLAGSGIMAALAFLLMYSTIEGFPLYTLSNVTSGTYYSRTEIPWAKISRMILINKDGVLLIGWNDGETDLAVAVGLLPMKASKLYDQISAGLDSKVPVEIIDGVDLGSPPGGNKA